MPDQRISVDPLITAPLTTDYIPIVSGGDNKRITLANFVNAATAISKVTITPPATGSTLTIIDGKTLTINKTISFTAADDTGVYTLPTGTKTLLATDGSGTALSGVTLSAVVPNTAPTSGQILAGNAGGTAYAPVSMSGDATLANTGALTLASTITAGGPAGSATVAPIITYDAKGRLTTVTSATITPAVGSITGLGTGVTTALVVNVGSAGAFVTFNGAGGTPSSLTGTNITGTASGLTAGTATNATNSTTTTKADNVSYFLTFVSANSSSNQGINVGPATYNPSTGAMGLTIFNAATGFQVGGAAASRKILVGNGTNYVASTETWAVPSTSGNVLTSDGTNWTSAAPAAAAAGSLTGATLAAGVTGSSLTSFGSGPTFTNPVITNIAPGANLTITQNSVAQVTFVSSGAAANTLYVSGGQVGINSAGPDSRFYVNGTNAAARIDFATAGLNYFDASSGTHFRDMSTNERMIITAAGTITFSSGVTNAAGTPGSLCYNTSTFEMTKNNALTCTVSASEYKTSIAPLTNGLDVLMQMNPSQFAYKDDPARLRWGFVADELQAVDSKLGDGYDTKGHAKSIDLSAIMAVNTKATQELCDKVAILEKRILVLSDGGIH